MIRPKALILFLGGMCGLFMVIALIASNRPTRQQAINEVFAELPKAGQEALESYIVRYGVEAIGFDDLQGTGGDDISFLTQTADDITNWRQDAQAGWCVFTLAQIRLKNGLDTHEFLVYLTADDEWQVIANETAFTKAGCQ